MCRWISSTGSCTVMLRRQRVIRIAPLRKRRRRRRSWLRSWHLETMKQKENTPCWIPELVILGGQMNRPAWVPLPLDPESDSWCRVTMSQSRLFWNRSMAWTTTGRRVPSFHIHVHVSVSPWTSGRNCGHASTRSEHEENLSVIAGWQPFHASLVRPARATQPLTQCLYWMHPTNKSS